MTYDALRTRFDREHIYIVELELDYCSLEFGVAPCTATGSGDAKCFNTFETCQDLPNYTLRTQTTGEITSTASTTGGTFFRTAGSFIADGFKVGHRIIVSGFSNPGNNGEFEIDSVSATFITVVDDASMSQENDVEGVEITLLSTKTYRFCEQRSPHPIGIDAIPCLKNVNITPSKIDVGGGLGERSSVSLEFSDFPHSDINIDKYVDERTWIASDRGTFWPKFRARNPNYQFRALRLLSGYLEGGQFIEDNFKASNYVIERMNVTDGRCSIKANDPLKKAAGNKAQVPAPSTGKLSADINDTVTSIVLEPAGVGDLEYPSSGFISISSEVVEFTLRTSDTLTVVRGARNTAASDHTEGDSAQLCYVQNNDVNIIVEDILISFAGIEPDFINTTEWQSEVDEYLSGSLDGIITRPTDVESVLKELAMAKPHFLAWDELRQRIKFTALKGPPSVANVVNMDENLIADSVKSKDLERKRVSTILVNYGQLDPTKPLGEISNYARTHARIDSESISKFSSNEVKTINCRWIAQIDDSSALLLAELIGRRWANIPREITFFLDDKDSSLSAGDLVSINHRDIVDPTGVPVDSIFQVVSKQESENFKYKGIEFLYGDQVPVDIGEEPDSITLSINERNIDLLDRYESIKGPASGSTNAVFIIDAGVIIGSATTGAAIDTGAWPAGATVKIINKGHVVGRGGNGGTVLGGDDGLPGRDGINMGYALFVENFGIIGGGGGGGGQHGIFDGGGGAGDLVGVGAPNGTLENGGNGVTDGGDLGEAGQSGDVGAGGAAGRAIDRNGFSLVYINKGDIRGLDT